MQKITRWIHGTTNPCKKENLEEKMGYAVYFIEIYLF
jgi:hypothetical protein